ncbi:hypothetical protein [Hymenobacter bucti]|uniref:Two-component sensor histidine kinase n=1 Tax=Hymenobacter bucti TaxID=1844114 RepID=A0ABW4QXK3_9BACT
MNRPLPLADTRYRVLAALLAVALLLSGALNCYLLTRADGLAAYSSLLGDDDEADDLSATRAELTLTQTMLARCQAANLRRDSTNLAVHPPGR